MFTSPASARCRRAKTAPHSPIEQPAAPYGATAITGASGYQGLTAEERTEAVALGRRVAEVASWLRAGRQEVAARQQQRQEAAQRYDPSA